jgi:membrane protein YdbS with pleckstrin-like domain
MLIPIIALVVILIVLGGIGFAVHVLWWVLIAAVILWLIGFFLHPGGTGGRRGRWYYW